MGRHEDRLATLQRGGDGLLPVGHHLKAIHRFVVVFFVFLWGKAKKAKQKMNQENQQQIYLHNYINKLYIIYLYSIDI